MTHTPPGTKFPGLSELKARIHERRHGRGPHPGDNDPVLIDDSPLPPGFEDRIHHLARVVFPFPIEREDIEDVFEIPTEIEDLLEELEERKLENVVEKLERKRQKKRQKDKNRKCWKLTFIPSEVSAAKLQSNNPTMLNPLPNDGNQWFRTAAGECRKWLPHEKKLIKAAMKKRKAMKEAYVRKYGCLHPKRKCHKF